MPIRLTRQTDQPLYLQAADQLRAQIETGYLVAPPPWHDRLIATKQITDIVASPLNQRALHAYLQRAVGSTRQRNPAQSSGRCAHFVI